MGTMSLGDVSRAWKMAALALESAALLACAVAAPMAGPVAGDAAGAAAERSGDIFKAGKLQSYQPIGIDDMIAITHRAAGELDLRQTGEEKHPDQLKLIYEDQRRQQITITLVRRTDKATEIHVDVGLLGNSGMGQLVMRQMLKDIPTPAAPAGQSDSAGRSISPGSDGGDSKESEPLSQAAK